ncbi:hypothetical protein DWW15_11745 [Subdoligranulum sp. AF14-43]|nr:hypothetical protein DWW15_11745 [Subdoligranulum sp. AF14-43]
MERLTSEINGRAVPVKFDLDFTLDMTQRDWRGLQEIFDRLAAYEETGLEPEDMKRAFNEDAVLKLAGQILGMSPDRLRELAQAKKEGRLVVLPCSIGDPVFMGTGRYKITGYEEDVCDGFYIGRDGVLQVKAQNYNGNHGTYGVIGQTAELTREAAEAALKEREAEHE